MVAVITGDIIQSRQKEASLWLTALKEVLNQYGTNPKEWEIFRGDSFQLIVTPEQALHISFVIKSFLKSKDINVRMAIGIGEVEYQTDKVTESNGTAFLNSGTCFDGLSKQTLALQSPWQDWDITLNTMLQLASLTMDKWTPKTAEVVLWKLQNPLMSQKEIAESLPKKRQGNISEALKRGGYDELHQLLVYYQKTIVALC
ncbi:SatD family protein [Flavobacterium sp. UMI-01]|uniref:SatD family protein n=1 Tax=Flavobacterium sp. UMI-01 TaxID=1441053 RepID=UPI001C7CD630|nr:SatD family protein [Flavobacterium sp. UMI-01]GIZ08523.1 hypothetical protein FUMI01_12500 [Flavobacterium sp. UMI-01]